MLENLFKRTLKIISVGLLITVSAVALFFTISGFLSKTEKVKANILLVEGWLPPSAIKMAFTEFSNNDYDFIITTGLKKSFDGCLLAMNGTLIFYPKEKLRQYNEITENTIEISAFSELDGENAACFSLFVNDSLLGSFTATKKEKKYSATWTGAPIAIDSIMVRFFNDKIGDFGDRNLYVRNVTINKSIIIPTLNNSVYDRGKPGGKNRIKNTANSNAEFAKEALLSLGIDSGSILAVPAKRVKRNRTLTSALAARDWLNSTNIKVSGINIISAGTHARRTWMTFNKVLGKSYNIGIVALPDYANAKGKKKIYKTLREAVGLIYYWFILLPY